MSQFVLHELAEWIECDDVGCTCCMHTGWVDWVWWCGLNILRAYGRR